MTIMCYYSVHGQYIHIPKNATTSILTRMYKLDDLTVEEVHKKVKPHAQVWNPKGPPTFAVVRHPWRRFVSAWKNKVYRPHAENLTLHRMGAPIGSDLEGFCEWFLSRTPNERNQEVHLRTQKSYLPSDLSAVNVMLHEDLPVHWQRAGYQALWGGLPIRNHTQDIDTPRYCSYRRRIEDIYECDLRLWLDNF